MLIVVMAFTICEENCENLFDGAKNFFHFSNSTRAPLWEPGRTGNRGGGKLMCNSAAHFGKAASEECRNSQSGEMVLADGCINASRVFCAASGHAGTPFACPGTPYQLTVQP